ncbi:MAG: KH domain-containing protein [Raoultibacter sp.]
MADLAADIAGLVRCTIEPLVEFKEELAVTSSLDEHGVVLVEVHVNTADAGKVIGRQGRVIKAVRTVARAAGSRTNTSVEVELID